MNGKPANCIKIGEKNNFATDVSQALTNIPNGRYGLHVRVKRFGSGGNFYAAVGNSTGEKIICNIPFAASMNEWSSYSKEFFQLNISDIMVVDGKCIISFHGEGGQEDYALIDDVCFYRY
jgi:hypothetical protein